MAQLDQNTQNVILGGGLIALLLLLINGIPNASGTPPIAMAHGYSVAPMASNAACIPCNANRGQ